MNETQELVERTKETIRFGKAHGTQGAAWDVIDPLVAALESLQAERDQLKMSLETIAATEMAESELLEQAEAERDQLAGEVERLKEVVLDSSTALERAEHRVAELEKAIPDPDKLEIMASLFDDSDQVMVWVFQQVKMPEEFDEKDREFLLNFYRGDAVQNDLRTWAKRARQALSSEGQG